MCHWKLISWRTLESMLTLKKNKYLPMRIMKTERLHNPILYVGQCLSYCLYILSERIDLFLEVQAFCCRMIRLFAHPLSRSSPASSHCVSPVELFFVGGGGGARSLALYKSFYTLCILYNVHDLCTFPTCLLF